MSWITLTAGDVLGAFGASEKVAYDAKRGDDTLPGIVTGVVAEVRGYVGVKHNLGPAGTLPEELRETAIIIARHRFLTTLPSDKLITEQRQKEHDRAEARLKAVASGEFSVQDPEGGVSGGSSQIVSQRTNPVTGTSMRGL